MGHCRLTKRVRLSHNGAMNTAHSDRFCILGAGTSGLAVAKNFLAAGIPFDCLEREDQIGGNWCYGKPSSSIYQSTHLISSKRLTEYTDFPMPEEFPEFPSHKLVFEYLRNYAEHFDLLPHIQFNTAVEWLEPISDVSKPEPNALASGDSGIRVEPESPEASAYGSVLGGKWRVKLASGEERLYRGVVIANGHNWDPRLPEFPGEFAGQVFHSSQYKTPEVLTGQRVLVVGGGNSGCDLAVEAATYAKRAVQSWRRGYPILPKFFKGKPIDACGETLLRWRWPVWARRLAAKLAVRWVLGPPELVGLPKPDHKLFESHPVINSRLHDSIAHGNLAIKPNVREFAGKTVHFLDGTSEEFDVILFATGFKVSLPFIDPAELNWREGRPDLYLNIFHPQRDDLFCVGLIQPDSGQWGLVDYQAQLVAKYLVGLEKQGSAVTRFKRLKAANERSWRRGKFLDSPRHRLEVEHFSYRRELKKRLAGLG